MGPRLQIYLSYGVSNFIFPIFVLADGEMAAGVGSDNMVNAIAQYAL